MQNNKMKLVNEAQKFLSENEKPKADIAKMDPNERLKLSDKIQTMQAKIHAEEIRAKGKDYAHKFFLDRFNFYINNNIIIFIMKTLCTHYHIRYNRGANRHLIIALNVLNDNWEFFYNECLRDLNIIKEFDQETRKCKGYRIYLLGCTYHSNEKGHVKMPDNKRSQKSDLTEEITENFKEIHNFIDSENQSQPQEVESATISNDLSYDPNESGDINFDYMLSEDIYSFGNDSTIEF